MKKIALLLMPLTFMVGGIFAAPTASAQPDGTWLVPNQIGPGTYQVQSSSSFGGYVEVCADLACKVDFDGSDYTGMIDNYVVSGPTYITVPSYAKAVTMKRISSMVKVG